MPPFLSDPPQWLYLVLIAAVVITGAVAAKNQDRRSLIRVAAAAAALLVVFLVDRFCEAPREEATRKVQDMAAAATAADGNRFVEHVSPSFRMTGGADRERLKTSPAWGLVRAHRARIAVWGFGQDAFQQLNDTTVEVGFYAKAEAEAGGGALVRYARAEFVKDPDGQYRIKTIKFYNPADRGMNAEEPIPGFP